MKEFKSNKTRELEVNRQIEEIKRVLNIDDYFDIRESIVDRIINFFKTACRKHVLLNCFSGKYNNLVDYLEGEKKSFFIRPFIHYYQKEDACLNFLKEVMTAVKKYRA